MKENRTCMVDIGLDDHTELRTVKIAAEETPQPRAPQTSMKCTGPR